MGVFSVRKIRTKTGRPRGRPKGWKKRSAEEDLTTIKITRNIWELLATEKDKYPKDRMTDILSRILMGRLDRIKELEQENRQLKTMMKQWREEYAIIEE